ncbi:MAG: hypothetical protein R3C03_19855 [Pirellulaceae bacterium]
MSDEFQDDIQDEIVDAQDPVTDEGKSGKKKTKKPKAAKVKKEKKSRKKTYEARATGRERKKIERPGLFEGFNLYTAALMLSAVFIVLASVLLFRELTSFGSIGNLPWRTDEAVVNISGG